MPEPLDTSKNYQSHRTIVPFLAEIPLQTELKKYLCSHCDYSFDELKENLPKALDLVSIQTICQWKHCWVDAYWAELGWLRLNFK